MKKTRILIVNGSAGTGKDTFIRYMASYCDASDACVLHSISTIDPVKECLRFLGWNGSKTDESRLILSELKKFWISNNNGPTEYSLNNIMSIINSGSTDDAIIVIQIREPSEISKIVGIVSKFSELGIYNVKISTLLIKRNIAVPTNNSDMNVDNYKYAYTIDNNSTLNALNNHATIIVEDLLEIKQIGGNLEL